MILEYSIKIRQNKIDVFTEDTLRSNMDFNTIKSERSLIIDSSDVMQGSGFIKSDIIVENIYTNNDFIVGYQLKKHFNKEDSNFKKEVFPAVNVNEFLKKYRRYLKEVNNYQIDRSINLNESLYIIYLETDKFNLLDTNLYTINKDTYQIESTNELPSKLYSISFSSKYAYKKTSDRLEITAEEILDISPGFYNIFPKYTSSKYSLIKNQEKYILENREALKINSEFNISFDNLNSSEFLIPPSNQTYLDYQEQNLTELNNIESFDYSEDKKYIVLLLQDNEYQKVFKLPEDKDSEDFTILMRSHLEFKRPYSFISNKSEVSIRDFNDELLEKIIIYNTDFYKIYNKP